VQKSGTANHSILTWESVDAWKPADCDKTVVDSIGAGDTFIAGMLFGLAQQEKDWSLKKKLAVANELGGRKVFQEGFQGIVREYVEEHGRVGDISL
jgi:ketohexokinase